MLYYETIFLSPNFIKVMSVLSYQSVRGFNINLCAVVLNTNFHGLVWIGMSELELYDRSLSCIWRLFFFPECRLGEENEDFFIVLEPVQVSLGIKKNKIKNTNHVWA